MSEQKSKLVKIGQRLRSKEGKEYLSFGSYSEEKEWQRFVEIRVTDGNGNVIARSKKNPALWLSDPRNSKRLSDENKSKIPSFVLEDILLDDMQEASTSAKT